MERTPSSSRLVSVGAFGKLPAVGDFVRVGLATEASRVLEEWLHQGVQTAHDKKGAAFKTAFLGGPVYAFVFRATLTGDKQALLGGVLRPSHDTVGRAFPLAVYTLLPLDAPPQLLPLAMGDFLDAAAQVVLDADRIGSGAELEARLASLPTTLDFAQPHRDYDWWTRATGTPDLWSAINGADSGDLRNMLGALVDLVAPFRGKEPPTTPLSVRLPLGSAGVAAASFWLDVLRAGLTWRTTTPTCFWYFGGTAGDILVQLGRTPPSTLLELWSPDPRNENVFDTTRSTYWRSDDSLRRLSPHASALLDRRPYVAELLHALWY